MDTATPTGPQLVLLTSELVGVADQADRPWAEKLLTVVTVAGDDFDSIPELIGAEDIAWLEQRAEKYGLVWDQPISAEVVDRFRQIAREAARSASQREASG